jgi:hypothetical protein
MSDAGKGKTALLLASVAANIFLVAFVLGRLSSPGIVPVPTFMDAQRQQQMQQQMMTAQQAGMQQGGPGNPGAPPGGFGGPGGPGGFGRPEGSGGPGGEFGGPPQRQAGNMPPPPQLLGPGDLFGPQDMQQNMQQMQKNFDKAQSMQRDFAQRLEQGPISKEEVLKHFAEVDAVMNGVKNQVQEKAAQKISTMPDEERKQFAARLKERRGQPGMGAPQGQMPNTPGGEGPPGMRGAPGGMPGQGSLPDQGQGFGRPSGQGMQGQGFPRGQGPGPGQPPGQFTGELGQGFGQGPEPGQQPPPR